MKTAVLSDIHVDINREYPVAQEFARYIKEQGARLAIIAGDVSESQQETLDTLNTIEQLSGARVLFVPGNHDLWGPKGDPDQIGAIYSRYAQDEHCLCGRDVVLGDTVVIGDVGWYDYSFGSGRYSFEEFEKMSLAGRTWQDSLRNAWTRDNLGRTQWMLSRLEARMAAYPGKSWCWSPTCCPSRSSPCPRRWPTGPTLTPFWAPAAWASCIAAIPWRWPSAAMSTTARPWKRTASPGCAGA